MMDSYFRPNSVSLFETLINRSISKSPYPDYKPPNDKNKKFFSLQKITIKNCEFSNVLFSPHSLLKDISALR